MLYVHAAADPREARQALARASLDRLGVCNRLNLALVDRGASGVVPALLEVFARARARGARRPSAPRGSTASRRSTGRLGHEWASDPERVATVTLDVVDGLDEAVRIANDETSGLAAAIVTEDEAAAQRVPRRLPRHGGVLERAHAVHGRLRAARHARDGHQRRPRAGPARAGDVPRPLAAPVPRRRRRHAAPVTRRRQARLDARRRRARAGAAVAAAARAARGRGARARRRAGLRRLVGRDRARAAAARRSPGGRRRRRSCRPPRRSARRGCRRVGRRRSRGEGLGAAQILLSAGDVAERASYVNAAQRASTRCSALGACRS